MNRSILIVICDFLLLSLLTFSTDINKMADESTQPPSRLVMATNPVVNSGADLAAAMKRALEESQSNREQLQQQLAQLQNASAQQQAQLGAQQSENRQLQEQYTSVKTNADSLAQQLQSVSTQAQQAQQQLALIQVKARQDSDEAAALRQQLDQMTRSNQAAISEQQRLNTELQLAQAEKRAAADRAALMQQEVQVAHAENAKLAEGFQTLATNSTQLTQEIRANRALAPNAIFSEFVSNRVSATFLGSRTGLFGSAVNDKKTTQTILFCDGTNYFALCHVQDTPLVLWDPGTDWDQFTGTLTGRSATVPVTQLAFHEQDPRVVVMPLTAAQAAQLGSKIYSISDDPYRFQDAVIVGADEGYYGQCDFQIELSAPQYVKLDRNLLKGLFGKFNPSRGDLVLSRGGDLLGIMVNNTYCLTMHNILTTAAIPFGTDLRSRHTGGMLAELYGRVFQMPLRLR